MNVIAFRHANKAPNTLFHCGPMMFKHFGDVAKIITLITHCEVPDNWDMV